MNSGTCIHTESQAVADGFCSTISRNKTRQGYARKRTLKLAGYFFVAQAI